MAEERAAIRVSAEERNLIFAGYRAHGNNWGRVVAHLLDHKVSKLWSSDFILKKKAFENTTRHGRSFCGVKSDHVLSRNKTKSKNQSIPGICVNFFIRFLEHLSNHMNFIIIIRFLYLIAPNPKVTCPIFCINTCAVVPFTIPW